MGSHPRDGASPRLWRPSHVQTRLLQLIEAKQTESSYGAKPQALQFTPASGGAGTQVQNLGLQFAGGFGQVQRHSGE
jgi:hypothetical protein